MLRDQYLSRFSKITTDLYELTARKSADYSGTADPFHNFRACEDFGVPMVKGILVRMSDKMSRAGNLLNSPDAPQVADERVIDTLRDLAVYAIILSIIIEEQADKPCRVE